MAYGPCEWPVRHIGDTATVIDPEVLQIAEQMATGLLWNWTGRVFGLCDLTVRPCRTKVTRQGYTGTGWYPLRFNGGWLTLGCGVCGDRCACEYTESVRLPYPTESVEEVRENGQVLSPSSYSLEEGRFLVRTDGGKWPARQNLNEPPGSPRTWEVDLRYGIEVPEGGQVAAGLLAVEVVKALTSDPTCSLPQRIQSVTRQGVTIAVMDDFESLADGKTGIWLVDSWMASVNKSQGGGRVYSPDMRRRDYGVRQR